MKLHYSRPTFELAEKTPPCFPASVPRGGTGNSQLPFNPSRTNHRDASTITPTSIIKTRDHHGATSTPSPPRRADRTPPVEDPLANRAIANDMVRSRDSLDPLHCAGGGETLQFGFGVELAEFEG